MASSKPLALDANCVLRWLLWDNPEQAEVVNRHLQTSRTRVHVSDLVLAEVVWVLGSYYEFDDRMIEGLVRKVVEHHNISCNRALFTKVLEHMNTTPKVSFVDTCLVFYAGLADAKLLTFDKKLAKKFPRQVRLGGR